MTYLDDDVRPLQYADIVAFYNNSLTNIQAKDVVSASVSRMQAVKSPAFTPAKLSVPAGAFLSTTPPDWQAARKTSAMAPSKGADLQQEIEGRLRLQFERVAGSSVAGASREQLKAAGLDYLVAHFDEIDSKQRGRIYFQDWMNYLRSENLKQK